MSNSSKLTYAQMAERIGELGLLPMANLIPDYPSLDSLTPKEDWHSDTEYDPWAWRVRFPGDGTAAYGKLLKKKNIFIAARLTPLVSIVLRNGKSAGQAYRDGNLSRDAHQVYTIIAEQQGIDTRELRAEAGMKATEAKKVYEAAITELQATGHVVISGVKIKRNADGEQSGWSSTSFETTDFWMESQGIQPYSGSLAEAKSELAEELDGLLPAKARAFIAKAWGV
ncbi:hypothetical protein SY83_03235 [Paenibacillus swuensis]|uniref:Uncharacterized protein n=1 Tax=Paenibacillus swuensis TaxID=1178515 RepID=A0A172TEK3_9BACL|nr:hypothetical protein [Paenibacillus swuensis]ANE45495.1 hypothetical protein SY83_03235 [Paenibacillus swuensis]